MFEFLGTIFQPKTIAALLMTALSGIFVTMPAHAEGTYQVGLNQPFVETNSTAPGAASNRDILVDIVTAGEVINISACGAADSNVLAFVIETPSGSVLPTYTPTALAGKILCANTMTTPIATPYRYTTTVAGRYKVRLINVTAANFNRFDVTVTASAAVNPDPTNATGIKGRVSSLTWQYSTGAYSLASATNADYFVLTPGGYPGTNYVWELDLNALAGNGYSIASNNKGVDAPRSGFSTDIAGNTVAAQFQNYINYPAIAGPPPSSAPAVTGFRFVDSAGQDYGISPGVTVGVQDTGFFQFTAPVDNATYSISIDVNKNGIFGDAGDVRLTGNVTNGFNSILWDGKNNSGVILPVGSYQARAEIRLGEFHFIANDVETSGGTQNGLTVYEATSPSTLVPTRVYWDDITVLGVGAGGTANTPLGAVSGTAAGYHTWGTFDAAGGGFGNNRYVDTFAYGATTQASLFVAIVTGDAPLTGSDGAVTITPTSKPGDTLALSVTDADLNSLSGIIETVLVSVRNNVTGEMEAVTLTETGANTGIFTGSVPTLFGTVAGPNNNGALNTQATDTVTVTYNDALSATGTAVARTANDTVSGGITGSVTITPTSNPGATLAIGVTDADLNANTLVAETVIVTVVNSMTGESELVTLTETGPNTGIFAGTLPTVAGLVAGTNNNGSMNVKAADTVVVTYADARAANGGPASPTATNTINSYNPLVATNDTIAGVDATLGATNLINVFNGDLVNLLPATAANAVLSVASGSSIPAGLTFNTATGDVGVVAGTTAATYSFVYQICEAANLPNCRTAMVSVTVLIPVAPVVANDDTATGVDGVAGAANVLNAFAGDTVNNVAATSANGILSVATGFTVPAALTFDTATGNISLVAGTAPGTYSFNYQLCEAANPTNCTTATVSITVAVPPVIIVATSDSVSGVNGVAGAANVVNAFTADTVGGAAATSVNSVLNVAPGFTVPTGLTFDTVTGNVSVVAGTAAGTYTFDYQICESGNPTNCQTATISVTVGIATAVIVATDDTASGINGASGAAAILNVFAGDTLDGAAATNANATLSVALGFTVPTGLIFDPATGDISVAAGTAAGTYSFDYQICETAVLANCETASASVTVVAAPLVAVVDSATGVNGASGAANVVNAFAGDTLNGAAATSANSTLSVATGSTVPSGLTFDTATGNVSVAAGTPAGTYSFDYQICEILNPTNCQIASISISVVASAVAAISDSATGINGASGAANVVNIYTGDTINGSAASAVSASLAVAVGSTVPAGLTFDTATGNVSVDAGTPAGSYAFDYQICERLNPANCQVATVSITVDAAPLVATSDSATGINGANGAANVVNVFTGDTLNGAAANATSATLAVAAGSTVPSGTLFDTATGKISVAAGTPAGTYSFDYQICEALNPANCQIASVSVTVVAAPLVAVADSATGVNGASGAANVVNAFAGDTLNGAAATSANSTLSVATGSTVPSGLTFDTATGNVSVAAGTPAGTYSFDYQICEILNPTNCQIATVSITVDAAPLVASADSVAAVNGASGAANVVNVLGGDTLNGNAATTSTVTLSIAAGSTVPAGLNFDPATGNVSVAAATPAGTYGFTYSVCEILNPTNCQTAAVSVVVDASIVTAANITATGVNGASGTNNVANVLAGNTVNGAAATTTNAILYVAAGSTVPSGLVFDPATGNVSVTVGTPAGTYNFVYQICEALNPANCQTASASVTVDASVIVVTADSVAAINGASGAVNVANAFAGDSVNGAAATPTNSMLSIAPGSAVPAGLVFDLATGNVGVTAGTPAGTYGFDYQLCEQLNPANCGTASISVTVEASVVVATADFASAVNGAMGAANVLNVFAADTVNGVSASTSNAVLSIATGSTVPAGLSFDTATGGVSVVAGTPAGIYSFDYQICEALNPGNCQVATVSITVDAAPLVAISDSATGINGASGASDVLNVFTADSVNGAAANAANAILSVATGSVVPSGLTFDAASGNVSVAPATPAGTYSFDYQICETLNPSNCQVATATVIVGMAPVVATADTVSAINGASGAANVVNVFTGDSINGAPANPTNSNLAVAAGSAVPTVLIFDTATGQVSVAAATPAGAYSFDYQICEALNPANCRIATVSITVDVAPLVATGASVSGVNGASGAANVVNAFASDTINGLAATSTNAVLAVAAGSTVPVGLAFDTATGNVSVAAGTPAGTYSFNYQLCEQLNPANCQTASISVTVDASVVIVSDDSASSINGASGAGNVLNAFTGDTVNGVAASAANATLSVATGSAVPAGLTFDIATGAVSVAAGTPAGRYSFDYQLCETLNPANCQIATISAKVIASVVVATADTASAVNGASGAGNVLNVLASDTVNGAAATIANAILSVATGLTIPVGLTFDTATGNVSVVAGTPAGIYIFDYQICEALNPANCQTASISVAVDASIVVATADAASAINGASGASNILNVFTGDSINGAAATSTNATLTVAPGFTVPAGLDFDAATGSVGISVGTPAGTYSFDYQICEALNPGNCEVATVSIIVDPSAMVTTGDDATGINGASGASNVLNAFTGDTVNGVAATGANALLSVAVGSNVPAGLTFDTSTGNVSVAVGTPAGRYSFDYQLCEMLNPTNCQTARISVKVDAAVVVATADSAMAINGTSGAGDVLNVFAGDTVSGNAATIANAILSVATGSTIPAGLTFDTATGYISVAAGTPAGVYSFDYQICEALNPANCQIARASVTVDAAPLIATDDSVSGVNGATGAANVVNAFTADTLNGVSASAASATLSVATGSTVPAGLVFDIATGAVSVSAGTPAGRYSFDYQLCEILNPTNCQTARIWVKVDASVVVATADSAMAINGASGAGNVLNVFAGDTVSGNAATIANAILSLAAGSSVPPGLVFDAATGNVSVTPGTPTGVYNFDYRICETLNPANCQTASVSVTVGASAIIATGDSASGINGASGASNVLNAFTGDTVNGVAATGANAVLSVATGSTVPAGLTFDTASGNVSVTPGTPAGRYSFDYQLCEMLNPTNCQTAGISVKVDAAVVVATADSALAVNGASGAGNVLNVFAGDTINGSAATIANAILSVAPGSTVPAGLTFDTATGAIDVLAGTPTGTYNFDYQICEALNPANCQVAAASVTVDASVLTAANISVTGVNGAIGATGVANVLIDNTVNGAVATTANAIISVSAGSVVPAGLNFDTATGNVSVEPGTAAGVYSFVYQICERLNPANCQTARVSITVDASVIAVMADNGNGVNGASGANNIVNAFTGDTINGLAATSSNAVLSVATGYVVPAGVAFDIATGHVDILAGTPAGTYVFDYQICEQLNPGNCRTSTISIIVDASAIIATPDSVAAINGATGAVNVANAFAGDSVNGVAATPANSVLSVAPGSTVPAELTFDAATGSVSVAAGTPAGTYSFSYQLCEALNPSNCQTTSISVVVEVALVVASADRIAAINGASGAANIVNVFSGDMVNGTAANTSNALLSVATGSVLPAGLTFDPATGNVSVASETPAGAYSFDYQICEILNPTNCRTATVSVTVAASNVVAAADSLASVNGASGASNVLNLLNGDTVNGAAATTANTVLSVASGSTVPVGLIFDAATGNVSVAPATPAGTYGFEYQICEALNPTNCRTATVSIGVDPSTVATNNIVATGVNGATGAPNVANILGGNFVNGVPATLANATLSVAPRSTVPAGLTFDLATGIVGVAPATPAGTYSFEYQICETLNPANCQVATVTITVDATTIAANADNATGINGASGSNNVVNAFGGDAINGAPASAANATLSVALGSTVPAGLAFDAATGNVSVAVGTAAGTYSFDYQICEILNPTNCRMASISVSVDVSAITASSDSATGINGATGAANVLNVLTGDTVNGAAVTIANARLSLATGSSVPAGLTFDAATGNVGVTAATPAGTYSFDYQICEILNPANCQTATASVTIVSAALVATADSANGINGASGASNVVNAYAGDVLNGANATASNTVLRIATGSSVPVGFAFDTGTGNVSVAAATPAGTYAFDYQICEILNPANCQVSAVSVTVVASNVTATADSVSDISGATGTANVLNVFTGDTINGVVAAPSSAVLSIAAGSTLPTGITFDATTGLVSVTAGTPAGTYSFDYQICEALNPVNCQVATALVAVVNPGPIAVDDATTVVTGQSVVIAVLANDSELGGELLTVTTATAPANGSVVINTDSTITYTPMTSFVGTDSFTYTICDPARQCTSANVSVIVHPSISALTGTVFLDLEGDSVKDASDPRQPDWFIEILRDGVVVATARTDANGNYNIAGLPLGAGYSVVFRHPTSNVVYGRTNGITLNPGITAVDLDRPIDPSGVVYDSVARTPIAGARVSIVDANGALLPTACLLDLSQQNQITGADGRYRFDIVPGGAAQCPTGETAYRLIVAGPADTLPGNSTVILANVGPFDPTGLASGAVVTNFAAPQGSDDTRYFFDFRLASGDPDVIHNHIPLDRAAALNPLVITKTSAKRTANVGDLVPYTIVVRNTQNIARNGVDVVDLMPAGFKYVNNTGRIGADAVAPVANGRELNWRSLNLPANGSLTISLVLTVGSGVNDGDYVNIATGRDALSGRLVSNEGQATVRVTPSPLFDCGEIIGKVFDDRNGNGYQDEGELGIAGARVATVNGLLITADQHGRYHVTCAAVPNARIGSNFILKLDPRSLPGGYQITTENPRVVRLTRGKITELNFGATLQKAITLELTSDAFEAGGNAVKQEWQAKLQELITSLQAKPSIVRLHYTAVSIDDVRGEERLKALSEQIQQLWRRAGEDRALLIERISAMATPSTGKE